MRKSESIAKLAEALSLAQAKMPVVRMNAQNPFLKNKYADLGAVIETSRPVLAENGLSVSQFPVNDGERVGVTSILMHKSGEWLEDTLTFNVTDSKGLSVAQASGVVISYARRYAWAAILGLYADEDTDGHSDNGGTKNTTGSKPVNGNGVKPEPKPMTLDDAKKVKDAHGVLYDIKSDEDLQRVIDNQNAPAEKKDAARLILESRKVTAQ